MSCSGLGIDRGNLSIDNFDVSVFSTEFDDEGSFNLAFNLDVDDWDVSDVSAYVSDISNIFKKKE